MNNEVRSKIFQLVDSIEDEKILQMVMEDVGYYASNKDIADDLTKEQLKELDETISEVNKNEKIDWKDFRKEMNAWKKG